MRHDDRAAFSIEVVWVTLERSWQVSSLRGFEAQHQPVGSYELEPAHDPFAEIEGRARHRCIEGLLGVIFDSTSEGFEVRQLELASCGPQKRVLLVNRFEGCELGGWQADRRDNNR